MKHKGAVTAPALEARYSIPGHLLVLVLTLALLVPAGWMLWSGVQQGQWLSQIFGLLGCLFLGPIALLLLARLTDRTVRLRISEDAIWIADHSPVPIPLRSVREVSDKGAWIALWLYNPSHFPPTTRFRRMVRQINGAQLRDQYGDVWFYPGLLDCSRREIMDRF